MRFLIGLILGAAMLAIGVYVSDTMAPPTETTTVTGETIQQRRTIVNWDVAAEKWDALRNRTRKQIDNLLSD